jgi:hypothetical protein
VFNEWHGLGASLLKRSPLRRATLHRENRTRL